jgi:hypothetical protein
MFCSIFIYFREKYKSLLPEIMNNTGQYYDEWLPGSVHSVLPRGMINNTLTKWKPIRKHLIKELADLNSAHQRIDKISNNNN